MDADVLIVGAGPTGLTLACELARRGVRVVVVEASDGPQAGSRGKGIQPRTLEVFDDLEIIDRVLPDGRFAMPIRSVLADGQVRIGGDEPEELKNRPDVPYTTSLLIPQWRIEEVLRSRLTELGGSVEFGTVLERFEQTRDSVSALLAHGGVGRTVNASWIVGCDGGHSSVRKQAGIAFEGETREDFRMIVADVEVRGLEDDFWSMWRTSSGFVSLCPLPGTAEFQFQASIAPGQDPDLGLENLQTILEQRTGRDDIRLAEPRWRSLWRANIRLAERYRARRALIAGDAAHVHSPAGGQGMNTGIQDAHNLGWKLAAVVHGAHDALLDTYEQERRPIAAHVLDLSNARLRQTIQNDGTAALRRDASTLQLDLGYRTSPLAREDRDPDAVLHAGDRAPDATAIMTIDGPRRLFDLLRGGRFTILDFRRNASAFPSVLGATVLQVVSNPARAGDIVDTDGTLEAAYAPTADTVVLVRPDGYIGVISDTGDATAVLDLLQEVQ